jgi:hypothetical protein
MGQKMDQDMRNEYGDLSVVLTMHFLVHAHVLFQLLLERDRHREGHLDHFRVG